MERNKTKNRNQYAILEKLFIFSGVTLAHTHLSSSGNNIVNNSRNGIYSTRCRYNWQLILKFHYIFHWVFLVSFIFYVFSVRKIQIHFFLHVTVNRRVTDCEYIYILRMKIYMYIHNWDLCINICSEYRLSLKNIGWMENPTITSEWMWKTS